MVDVTGVIRSAIDVRRTLVGLAAANLKVGPGEGIRAGGRLARLPTRHHAGHQGDQAEYIAAIERHLEHFARLHHLAQRRILGLQERSLSGDFHRLADIAHLHRNVNADGALHFYRDRFARKASEAGVLYLHAVLTGHNVDELIVAGVIRLRGAPLAGAEVNERDVGLGHRARRRVGHGAYE